MHDALLAAITYADARAIKAAGIQNTTDRARLVDILREALGNRRPAEQAQHPGDQRTLSL